MFTIVYLRIPFVLAINSENRPLTPLFLALSPLVTRSSLTLSISFFGWSVSLFFLQVFAENLQGKQIFCLLPPPSSPHFPPPPQILYFSRISKIAAIFFAFRFHGTFFFVLLEFSVASLSRFPST